MLVEDDPNVRKVCEEALTQHGYRVLAAESGSAALAIAERHGGAIDLLVSDIVMQGMSGRALFEKLKGTHQGLRGLFMSGYNDEALLRGSTGPFGGRLLRKPFAPGKLARRVHEALMEQDIRDPA
jgi:CheY-like chemotaxis protein